MKKAVCFLALFFAVNNSVFACSCAAPKPVQDGFSRMDTVFTGKVASIRQTEDKNYVKFKVLHSYKGAAGNSIEIVTGVGRGDCGFDFIVDKEYLVYAYREGKDPAAPLYTNVCTRTAELSRASKDIAELNKITAPGSAGKQK